MQWTIEGARKTGEDVRVVIEANDEESASREAWRQGIMVEKASPLLDYESRESRESLKNRMKGDQKTTAPLPGYGSIRDGANAARLMASFFLAVGVVSGIGGFIAVITTAGTESYGIRTLSTADITLAVSCLLWGFGVAFVAIVVRMLAGVADAIADIAANSYHLRK